MIRSQKAETNCANSWTTPGRCGPDHAGPAGAPHEAVSAAATRKASRAAQQDHPVLVGFQNSATGLTWASTRLVRIETGIFVTLAAIVVGVTFLVVRRRDA